VRRVTGFDLAVVGGGPAGLAAAIAARQRDLSVVVLESGEPGRDKACGEGILPDGVAALAELGVPLAGLGRPFRGIGFADETRGVAGDFPDRPGLSVRRTRLHGALAATAEAAGAVLRWRTRVESLTEDGLRLASGERLGARTVVGADGLHSRVRRWAGLDRGAAPYRRFGVRRHYRLAPWSERVEVHWRDGCEAYLTPVGENELGVAMLWSGGPSRFDRLLERFPELASRLSGAARLSEDRGAGPFHQRARAAVRGRVALLGDAAGYLDAITGEGLALAFREAQALARSVERGGLEDYARASRRLRRLPETLTRLLLVAERHPALRRRFFAALERDPRLFARLLAVHCRALPARRLGILTAARLAGALVGV
jgi:flavin-dependent dehydrogenase